MPNNKKEYTGKNLAEAIAKACADLNGSQEELDIEVVSAGSAGIFGLCKRQSVILASRQRPSAAQPETPLQNEGLPAEKSSRHHTKPPREQPPPKKGPRTSQAGSEQKPRPPKTERGPRSTPVEPGLSPRRQTAFSKPEPESTLPLSPESVDGIKELLETLLRLMDFPAEVSMSATGNKVTAHIVTTDTTADIIGRNGSTIDALQYLLRKIITQKFPEKIHLNLDAGSYREDRQQELAALAIEMADKVKATGKSQVISALNPAERRIVHITLQDDTEIRSSSVGEGMFKKVRISLPGQGRKRTNAPGQERSLDSED